MSTNADGILGFIGKALPWIGAIATSNIPGLIGLAANQIGEATGGTVAATADGIATAVAAVKDPEVMLKLKAADAMLQEHLMKMGFENAEALAKVATDDRVSARDRDTKIVQATGHNYRADFLAIIAIVAMALCAFALFRVKIPDDNRELMCTLIGALVMIVKDIYGFEFSTTRDSHEKTGAIVNMASSTNGNGTTH